MDEISMLLTMKYIRNAEYWINTKQSGENGSYKNSWAWNLPYYFLMKKQCSGGIQDTPQTLKDWKLP